MGGSGRVWNFMTWTQPNPLSKFVFVTQPNPPHQALKTDPTWRVGLGQINFGWLAGWLHTPIHTYRGDERTNQATHECLGQKSKSSYLRDGWTNQASHKCLGKKSKPSYLLGRWTNQATHEYHGIKF